MSPTKLSDKIRKRNTTTPLFSGLLQNFSYSKGLQKKPTLQEGNSRFVNFVISTLGDNILAK